MRSIILLVCLIIVVGCSNTDKIEVLHKQIDMPDTNRSEKNPKVFMAWSPAENLGAPDNLEDFLAMSIEDRARILATHDLMFTFPEMMGVTWYIDKENPYPMLSTQLVDFYTDTPDISKSLRVKESILDINPNYKLLAEIHVREHFYVDPTTITVQTPHWEYGALPPDSEYWLLDASDNKVPSWGEDTNGNGVIEENEAQAFLIDFRDSDYQKLVVNKAIALYESGLFDGVFFDWWTETHNSLTNIDYTNVYAPLEEEIAARVELLKKIRKALPEDFLIIVNANYNTLPETGQYINGIYMECFKELDAIGYSDVQLRKIESTLLWANDNLREPILNCLEGWRDVEIYNADMQTRIDERNSEKNLQHMRMLTSLMLTHSDGYILFSDSNYQPTTDHLHNYYDYWALNLGSPISDKGITATDQEHVYIRVYENGFTVYNGSNTAVTYNGITVNAYDGYIQIVEIND